MSVAPVTGEDCLELLRHNETMAVDTITSAVIEEIEAQATSFFHIQNLEYLAHGQDHVVSLSALNTGP